jgi:transposase-like protein
MIEDESDDLRLEICPDNCRSAEVLVPLIKKHVLDGTIIRTDFWRAYDCLSEHGYIHQKVNHSDAVNPFVAEDGTHTQRIESQWRVVKRFFYKDNYNHPENFADVIMEFMWRNNIIKNKKDPFMEILNVV